ncbi:hypothetical protein SAMN05444157_3837 [Frankineae bacterium MT45]|nr:hypothetical protein SAMN05444157_3837 [Frankineae bacterium MT45]
MVMAISSFVLSPQASAAYSFANSQIVAKANSYAIGYSGGQCKVWAGNVVNAVLAANGIKARVGGYGSPGGAYYGAYANAGGTLISASTAQPGDLVQIVNASQRNSDSPTGRLHTAIIVGTTTTAGTFVVRDSNWNLDGKVSQHNLNPVTWANAGGSTAYFWRFGAASGGGGKTSATQMILDAAGNVWAKSSVGVGGWTEEVQGGIGKVAVGSDGTQMILDGAGNVWAKSSVGVGGWTEEVQGGITAIATGGGVQIILDGAGNVWAKSSVGVGGWTEEVQGGIGKVAVGSDGTQMILDGAGNVWAKSSVGVGGWTEEVQGGITAIATGGGVQIILDGAGNVWAKSSVGVGGWTEEVQGGMIAIATG